jgi:hypothetical protein
MNKPGNYEVYLTDVKGQKIEKRSTLFNLTLDDIYNLNDLPNGQYFITISNNGKAIQTKSIIKN